MEYEDDMKKRNQGFTLVELAIVLVTIGLIISAVSISQNLQRSAETQKIKQKYVDQWVTAYNQYYNRTGVVVGDSQQEPRYMVAGEYYEYDKGHGQGIPAASDSQIAIDAEELYRICEGKGLKRGSGGESANYVLTEDSAKATLNGESRGGSGTVLGAGEGLHAYMDKHGIRMPSARAEGREDRYVYLDSNGNPQELQVCFQWFPAGYTHGSGNAMILRGLTPDLARELDRMIDGKADAREGFFRQWNDSPNDAQGQSGAAGVQWLGVNTQSVDDVVEDNESGDNLDEDRIFLVTAVYKMDQ